MCVWLTHRVAVQQQDAVGVGRGLQAHVEGVDPVAVLLVLKGQIRGQRQPTDLQNFHLCANRVTDHGASPS